MPFEYNIRVVFVIIIILTHSDRALFNLNALVSFLGKIVSAALSTILPGASTREFKSNDDFVPSHYVSLYYQISVPFLVVCHKDLYPRSRYMTSMLSYVIWHDGRGQLPQFEQ